MNSNSHRELIGDAWLIRRSAQKKVRSQSSILQIEKIQAFLQDNCQSQGLWLECAKGVLARNNIDSKIFSLALCTLLEKGHGKERNIILTGPAKFGKTSPGTNLQSSARHLFKFSQLTVYYG